MVADWLVFLAALGLGERRFNNLAKTPSRKGKRKTHNPVFVGRLHGC
jgi:hypothetical protein